MAEPLTDREAAEAIEQFGMDLIRLNADFGKLCARMPPAAIYGVNAIPDQDRITTIAGQLLLLGQQLSARCDATLSRSESL